MTIQLYYTCTHCSRHLPVGMSCGCKTLKEQGGIERLEAINAMQAEMIDNLQDAVGNYDAEGKHLKSVAKNHALETADLREKNTALRQENADLRALIAGLREAATHRGMEVVELRSKAAKLRVEVKDLLENNESLKEEVGDLGEDVGDLMEQRSDLAELYDKLRDDFVALQVKNSRLVEDRDEKVRLNEALSKHILALERIIKLEDMKP